MFVSVHVKITFHIFHRYNSKNITISLSSFREKNAICICCLYHLSPFQSERGYHHSTYTDLKVIKILFLSNPVLKFHFSSYLTVKISWYNWWPSFPRNHSISFLLGNTSFNCPLSSPVTLSKNVARTFLDTFKKWSIWYSSQSHLFFLFIH